MTLAAALLIALCGGCGARPAVPGVNDSGTPDTSLTPDSITRPDVAALDAPASVCGTNAECAPNDYCAVDRGCLGKGGKLGRCVPRPEGCFTLAAPVCGCDGATYGNACGAASAGVNVAYDGSCGDICGTSRDLPVCKLGTRCDFSSCGAVEGRCVAQPSQNTCLAISAFVPVCGCDGKTYTHDCWRVLAGAALAHAGACSGSGKVTLVTNKRAYTSAEQVKATLTNGSASSVFVDVCAAFNREHRRAGAWVDTGPTVLCGAGGYAQELLPNQSIAQSVHLTGGQWRLSITVGVGCKPGAPFPLGCASTTTVRSLDIEMLPSAKECLDFDAKYRAALPGALACNSALSKPQCDKPISDALLCQCTTFVETTTGLDAIKQQWDDALCGNTGGLPGCPPMPCPKPGPQSCINNRCQ